MKSGRQAYRMLILKRETVSSPSAFLICCALWEGTVRLDWVDGRFFPAPSTVGVALWNLIANGALLGKFWLLRPGSAQGTGPES